MTTRRFVLAHKQARFNAIEAVRNAPEGDVVVIGPAPRTLNQNAKFHALCEDFARSRIEFAGKRRSKEDWKTLLVSGHAAATRQESAEVVQGLEGEVVSLRESTAGMSKARLASLIEYSQAMAVELGVRLRAPERANE